VRRRWASNRPGRQGTADASADPRSEAAPIEGNRRLSVAAAVASVLAHVALLGGFGMVHWRRSAAGTGANVVVPSVVQIQRLMESTPLTPKPEMRPLFSSHRTIPLGRKALDIPGAGKIELSAPVDPTAWLGADDASVGSPSAAEPTGVSFFGQTTAVRKICYVVDCTGSMHGRFGLVRRQLIDSIRRLEPDQFFYIIFFLDGNRLLETGGGRMVRATPSAKAQAEAFINAARPSGPTNAVQALLRAMDIRDALNRPPQLIYFLTDGFDLDESVGAADFAAQIEQQRRRRAPQTPIHTIGFWTEAGDVAILKRLAEASGGRFTGVQW